MSYKATVFRVLIASPDDVQPERSVARDVLGEWNAVHSAKRKMVLLPVTWESHSSPEMGDRPQAIINRQVLEESDLLIAVFWTRLGTPTGEYASGTVEEIEKHLEPGKPAMLYFSDAPVRLESVDEKQYRALKEFRESCRTRGLCETYSDLNDFQTKLYRHLQMKINEDPLFAVESGLNSGTEAEALVIPIPTSMSIPSLSREAVVMLKEAAEDAHGAIIRTRSLGGTAIHVNGKSLIEGNDPRSMALWEGALEELENAGLIIAASYKREVFQLTRKGYEVADKLAK
ncbi:MAG: DUF4062 domain-containing protein [Actinobacteria bacterium]|nr:DUF4062 domain-containing protein [Actinomycetota bacterium]